MKVNGFTAFLVFQLYAVLTVISVVVFRPGPWTTTRWVGFAIAVPAAALLFVARWQLGKSFSVTPQARELVTYGLYSKIRNPIYVCGALMLDGILVALQRPHATFFLLLVLIPVQIVRVRKECRILEAAFGEEYRAYRGTT
jgi:protein-S-isoprenylcysteine O-methyltransferase Ste14